MSVVIGAVVPGLPHPLLCPEQNPGWGSVRAGFEEARRRIEASGADLMLVYSTTWSSIVGHQVQADPEPEWVHVDELFHDLGSIPYKFKMDVDFARRWVEAGHRRGLSMRAVNYHGFPIDTGSVVALKLLNPGNRIPAMIVSANIYADRAETIVLAKAARDAIGDRKVAAVVSMTLSNRFFTDFVDPAEDHIHSAKDDEWNRKLLEFLEAGRLEDVAQLSREIQKQIRIKKVVAFKPMWFLSALMGNHNEYQGKVHAYAPIVGTGCAVVTLTPSDAGVGLKEFDEDDVEVWRGDRGVISGAAAPAAPAPAAPAPVAPPAPAPPPPAPRGDVVVTETAAKPVGAYPHARRVGDMLYLSGVGPRDPQTNEIPGGPVRDAAGQPLPYDVAAQTRATIENVRRILEAAGSSLDKVIDVTVFLIDMDRDFKAYNAVYNELLGPHQATRTTLAIKALPTPIAVELKVIAKA